MNVFVPTPLQSYTGGRSRVDGVGATLSDVLADLDARYPGIRFRMVDEQDRIREHIRLFVNTELAPTLAQRVEPGDDVHIIAALSGG
jgi:molybdopterin converting factor small subunit